MVSSFEIFKKQLDEAVGLIEESEAVKHEEFESSTSGNELIDTQSLLARCESVCNKYVPTKPTIRIIHHLACSGGTLISKCISALPNVYLLSEVHPFSELGKTKDNPHYAPTDISTLAYFANIPNHMELSRKLFKQSINEVYEHVNQLGGSLVLRAHTHTDFNTSKPIPEKSSLVAILEDDYEVKSILTLRDPIDSYSSLMKNGWVHFEPKSFDEYCRRLLLLVEQFNPAQIFKYEDFLKDPQEQMKLIARKLELPYEETFEDIFDLFNVTGDSGRTSNIIGLRERIAPENIIIESEESKYYGQYLTISKIW